MKKQIFALFILWGTQSALAQEPAPVVLGDDSQKSDLNPRQYQILVTDEFEDYVVNSGTPVRVGKDKINLYKYTDVNRVLRQTTGVYVREEDGQGLRPNIGLRGTNPDRSKKVVLLEDGVLSGPAPYAAPAAYYTPSMSHIETLDVYKGFSAVPYGPNSIGGAVNYLSLGVPTKLTPTLEASAGAFNTQRYRASVGDSGESGGYILQLARLSSDGFKKLDGGGDVGFVQNDIFFKGRLNLPTVGGAIQYVETRLGWADEDSNETYLGLSMDDWRSSPYRRYSSSALDEMKWEHTQVAVEHNLQFENSALKTTFYRNDFERLWYRLDGFRDQAKSLFNILNDPTANSSDYNILAGIDDSANDVTGNSDLRVAGNQRTFYSQGLQTRWNGNYNFWGARHDVELGLRFHMDQIRRSHSQDMYAMTTGRMVRTADPRTMTALNSNRASAWTFNFLENMHVGNFVLTFLGRVEEVKFKYTDNLGGGDDISRRSDTVFAPGFGALYKITERFSVKGSVNSGVSVAGLNDQGQEAKEESVNYELGAKYISEKGDQQAELVVFFNDYSNITGTCSSSTGCTNLQLDQQYNGGAADIYGLESRLAQNFFYGAWSFPVQLNLTVLNAKFANDFESGSAEWGLGNVTKGDPLPYVPKLQYTLTFGSVYKKFTQEFAFIYQQKSYDQSVPTGRREIPAFGIADWTGRYAVSDQAQVFARVDNILDKDYLVSLRPYGARSGKPQSFMVGLSYTF